MRKKLQNKKLGPNDRCTICGEKMKRCLGHRSNSFSPLILIGLYMLFFVILVVGTIWYFTGPDESETSILQDSTVALPLQRSDDISVQGNPKLSKSEVIASCKAIQIFRSDDFFSNGLLHEEERGIWLHSFGRISEQAAGQAHYSYEVIGQSAPSRKYISSIINLNISGLFRVLVYFPGPKGVFEEEYMSEVPDQQLGDVNLFEVVTYYTLLSNERRYPCVGKCAFSGESFEEYLILCDSAVVRKGTPLIGDDGNILIVVRSLSNQISLSEKIQASFNFDFPEVVTAVNFQLNVDNLPNYQFVLQKLTGEKVSAFFTPVHIFRGDTFTGTGTLYESPRGWRIATVEHLFSQEYGPSYYTYQILQPFDTTKHSIAQILNPKDKVAEYGEITAFSQSDVVFCVPGSSKLISGFSKWKPGPNFSQEVKLRSFLETTDIHQFTSLTTGETFEAIGFAEVGGQIFLALPCSSLAGESGSGFINKEGDLLVLCKSIMLSAVNKKRLSIPPEIKELSLGLMLKQTTAAIAQTIQKNAQR